MFEFEIIVVFENGWGFGFLFAWDMLVIFIRFEACSSDRVLDAVYLPIFCLIDFLIDYNCLYIFFV